MRVKNVGNQEAHTVTAILRSGHSLFVVTDSTGSFDDIPAGGSAENDADRFSVRVNSGLRPGTIVPCTLLLHCENWGYDWKYVFTIQVGMAPRPGQYVVTLDTGSVSLSVCAIGSLGFNEPGGTGNGFRVPKTAANTLYYGSIMAGNADAYLVDHFFSRPASGPTHKDWVMEDSFRFVFPSFPADMHWMNTMNDAGHTSPRRLRAEQHWYMNANPTNSNWIVATLELKNDGTSPLNGMYAGIIGDFDVGSSPTANIAGSDETRRAVWMAQATSENPTVGFVLLDPPMFANLTAVDHARYVYPDSAMTDGMKWRLLNGTITLRQSNRSYDWSVLVSAGPFNLPVGSSQKLAFAVVGATSRAGWFAAVDSAQKWYDANLVGVDEDKPPSGRIDQPLVLWPNPFSRATYLYYFAPTASRVCLSVYDALGREIERTYFDADVGVSRYFWQPQNLAPGIYFLKATTLNRETTAKVLLLD